MPNQILRSLSAADRWMLSLHPIAAYNLGRAIRVAAPLELGRLASALELLRFEQPILTARVQSDKLVRCERSPARVEHKPDGDWQSLFRELANRPFDPRGEAPMHRLAVAGDRWLIFSVAHGLTDGLGMNHLATRLLQLYQELATEDEASVRRGLTPREREPEFAELFPLTLAQRVRGAWMTMRDVRATRRNQSRALPMEPVPFAQSQSAAIFRRPEKLSVSALRAEAKQRGTTVGAALYGACLKAGAGLLSALEPVQSDFRSPDETPLTFSITVTMRPHAKVPLPTDVLGNFGAVVRADHKVQSRADAWALALMYEGLHQRARDPLLVPNMLAFRTLFRVLARSGRPRAGLPAPMLNVTNLGPFAGAAEEVYALTPSSLFAPMVNCQAVSVRDRFCFSFTYSHPSSSQAHVEELSDRVVAVLEQMGAIG